MAKPENNTPKANPGPISEEELMDLVEAVLTEDNPFFIPPEMIPDGYAVEWKRKTVFGAPAPNQASYEVNLARTRWEPVSLSTHPSFKPLLPSGYDKDSVEKEGMMLYIRPKAISDKVREIQKIKADNQLSQKMESVGQTGSGEAPRVVTKFKRSYEAVSVPDKG